MHTWFTMGVTFLWSLLWLSIILLSDKWPIVGLPSTLAQRPLWSSSEEVVDNTCRRLWLFLGVGHIHALILVSHTFVPEPGHSRSNTWLMFASLHEMTYLCSKRKSRSTFLKCHYCICECHIARVVDYVFSIISVPQLGANKWPNLCPATK